MQHRTLAAILAAPPVIFGLALACTPGPLTDSRLIYNIETWTKNTTSCEAGPEVSPRPDTHLAVNKVGDPEGAAVVVATCSDRDTCLQRTEDLATFTPSKTDVEGTYRSRGFFRNDNAGVDCAGVLEIRTLVLAEEGGVRTASYQLEDRRVDIPNGASCTDADMVAAALNGACSSRELIFGRFEREDDDDDDGTSSGGGGDIGFGD